MSSQTTPETTTLQHTDGTTGESRPPTDEDARVLAAERTDDPGQIRDEIASTRARMSGTIDALEDRVTPSRVVDRNRARVRSRWQSVRDTVMGSVDDATPDRDSSGRDLSDVAGDAKQTAQQAPQRVKQRTRGNPLGAGMIAFGLGAIIGSALPESDAEQQAAERAADNMDTARLRQEAQRVAQEVREPVEEKARSAADEVKQTAQGEAETVKQDAKGSAEQIRSHAEAEARDAQGSVRDAARDVRQDG